MEATFIRKLDDGRPADARLYRLDKSVTFQRYDGDKRTTDMVVVSAVTAMGGSETYIFPADLDGNVLSWLELPGSFRGGLDHEKALRQLAEELD